MHSQEVLLWAIENGLAVLKHILFNFAKPPSDTLLCYE